MRTIKNSMFPKCDPDVLKLVAEFGGWQRVLDPSFEITEEFAQRFEACGYSRDRLYKIKSTDACSQRT